MDLIVSKLKSTVSSTVSNFNNILPGNSVTRDYEILNQQASAGPGLVWKVFSGIKKTTKEEASVFILEKKILEKLNKRDRESIFEIFRKGVFQLTKLKHPSILKIQHPLEESRDSFAFATEPIFASLSNLLGNVENIELVPSHLKLFEFYDIEIKYGLFHISEALAFLHTDAKLLHGNICPEVIMVNKKGAWKLAGFDFCLQPINANDYPLKFFCININNFISNHSIFTLPNLDYVAPEYVSNSLQEPTLTSASDMFSFGSLIYSIFNKGKSLLAINGQLSSIKSSRMDQISNLSEKTFNCLPQEFRSPTRSLLNFDPTFRPNAHQFIKLDIFEDISVRSLQYLDTLFQFNNLERSNFYKGLSLIIKSMPKRIKLNRVFFCLVNEFINPDMVPFVLPIVFEIAQELSDEEFLENVLPPLLNVFPMKEPVQISIILMNNIELLLKKCKNHQDSVKNQILPLFCSTLENDNPQVVQLCLTTLPTVAHLLDQPSIKNAIIPRIKKLCINTEQLSTRVNCLLCMAKLLPFLDKWIVIDDILSFFTLIKSKEPAVIMAIIGIYKLTLENSKLGLTKEVMASKAIPFLMPLSIENGLTTAQFFSITNLVKEMINLIEKEQKVKLEQLDDIKIKQNQSTEIVIKNFDAFQPFQSFIEPKETKDIENKTNLNQDSEKILSPSDQNSSSNNLSFLLSPSKASTICETKTKNLTASLINSNLTHQPLQPTTNFSNLINSNFNHSNVTMQNNSNQTLMFQLSNPIQVNNQSRPNYNFSSLDNLNIPGIKKQPKGLSLNSMTTPQINCLNNLTLNTTSTSFNKLSEKDLREFLN